MAQQESPSFPRKRRPEAEVGEDVKIVCFAVFAAGVRRFGIELL